MKNPGLPAAKSDSAQPESGYQNNETQGLDNLIQGTGAEKQQPAFGQSNDQ